MVLAYFTDPNTLFYKFSDIYDASLVSWISPLLHYICILTIILTILLIIIIIWKTPNEMTNFKVYAIPFGIHTLCLEIVLLIFKPVLLHPFFVLVSLDMTNMVNPRSPQLLLLLFVLTAYFAMSLIDCIMGMSAERYYAIAKINTNHNTFPQNLFHSFQALSFLFLLAALICVAMDVVIYEFIMDKKEATKYLTIHLIESEQTYTLSSMLAFRTDINPTSFIIGLSVFVVFIFSRYFIAMIYLCLIARESFCRNIQVIMSPALQKQNSMLLRCTISQFLGFLIFAALPAFVILLLYFFVSTPSKIIYACFLSVNLFGLYGITMTVICISPYRNFIKDAFRLKFRKVSQSPPPLYPPPLPRPPAFDHDRLVAECLRDTGSF